MKAAFCGYKLVESLQISTYLDRDVNLPVLICFLSVSNLSFLRGSGLFWSLWRGGGLMVTAFVSRLSGLVWGHCICTREKCSAYACLLCFRREFAIEIIRDNKTN